VTKEELYSNLSKEMADYCVARMKPYEDPRTGQSITGGMGGIVRRSVYFRVSNPH
jgi:spectrin alpha